MKTTEINIVEVSDKCLVCKKRKAIEGLCSQTSYPYCPECLNKRKLWRKVKESAFFRRSCSIPFNY